MAILATLTSLTLLSGLSSAGPRDSTGTPWEFGLASDVTNELFREQEYLDSTFTSRGLVGAPEVRTGLVAAASWARAFRDGDLKVSLRPDLMLGTKTRRLALASSIRTQGLDRWSWAVDPVIHAARDESFGLERTEVAGTLMARVRRDFGLLRDQALELRMAGDLLEYPDLGTAFGLAHRNGMIGFRFERAGLDPLELHAEVRTWARTFPDSMSRDHLEHQAEISITRDIASIHSFGLRVGSHWRTTVNDVPSSRDRFTYHELQFDWNSHFGAGHSLRVTLEGEATRFADPDSVLDFDYQVVRTSARWHWQWNGASGGSAGVRWERLGAGWNPSERYAEWALLAEYERFTLGSWITLNPVYFERQYDVTTMGEGFDLQLFHSNFRGGELFVTLERALPGSVRVRGTGVGRVEWHEESADDARSLYFSLDVRRLF